MIGVETLQSSKINSSREKRISKKDSSILIGNALDHYDSAIYGFLAPLLGIYFFPNYDPIVQLILTYSILATSLITRPVGSLIFGVIARRHGPVSVMSYSLIGVAITSVCIGFLPTYLDIGWMAPFLLILIRMIKGVFAAGESTIAKMYIMENKPAADALKSSYLYQSSSMFGTILASAAVTLALPSEAWRVCFWIGGITGIMGYFLRRFSDTSVKRQSYDTFQPSKFPSLWSNRANILRIAMATGLGHITGTIPFVFMNCFVPLISTITLETMMILNTALLAVDMVLIPVLGRITLRFDPVKVMVLASLILSLTIIPLFAFLPQASLEFVVFVRMWIVFWGVIFLCPLNFWFRNLIPGADQYLLIGLSGALGASTIGRATTPLCLWLWYVSGWAFLPAVYMAVIMLATAYIIYSTKQNILIPVEQ
ncbi:MAG: MFS transporter [Parachlamydiaceae bacterium]|nr:MFS transporter [Parachlamydiaceae bacterium]